MRLIDADILIEKIGIGKDCNECQHSERKLYCNWKPDVVDICEAICTAPTIEPEQRWIPWNSGKFPEESGTYIVTAYDGVTERVTFAKYQKRLKRWELTGARAYWRVLAWMPLPEPWKGGEG